LVACPLWGQAVPLKKTVGPKDFSKWHTLRFPQISGNGKWISYLLDYEQQQDTLFVLDSKRRNKFKFPGGHLGQFEPNDNPSTFSFNDKQKGVGILNLKTEKTIWDRKAQRFEYTKDGSYLACYTPKKQDGYLKLLNLKMNENTVFNGVQHFKFDPTGKKAVLIVGDSIQGDRVSLLRLDDMENTLIVSSPNSEFLLPTWNKEGDGFVFMESTKNAKQRLYYYQDTKTPILKELENHDLKELNGVGISRRNLSFSKDGKRVFFWTQDLDNRMKEEEIDEVEVLVKVQIWKGTDKWIYPRQKQEGQFNKDRLAVWWPQTKRVFQIGTAEQPEAILTGEQKFALTYNPLTYEPQYRDIADSDYYIANLETGEKKLCINKLPIAWDYLSISPNGEFIAYFKDCNWWFYNILTHEHLNVSNEIDVSLKYKYAPHSVDETPYGYMGWTANNEFLVYDKYDIWKISATQRPDRLTKGRGIQKQYRAYNNLYRGFYRFWKFDKNKIYDLSEENLFSVRDSLFNYGYVKRKPNGTIQPFLNEQGKISHLRKAKFSEDYIYLKEKNTLAPAIYKIKGSQSKLLVQSNPQQHKFAIGKTELISYKNEQGESLHGLLHFPDNYEKGKQYPMIVHVYELQSKKYQNYINPSHSSMDGYSYRNLTAAGYFVLEPDIVIQQGNPGISATDCVVSAVSKVMEKGIIKEDAIGLMGHSFGGYSTSFIISQTNLFSAAIVGSGIFNIVSSYHTVNQNDGVPMVYIYENEQWQMGKSFYDDREGYFQNSPLFHAKSIKTPTLIWTGNKDYHADWHQSEQMYMALRRLGTEVELLVYEDEPHVLMLPRNQKDLTERIQKWFDMHLMK